MVYPWQEAEWTQLNQQRRSHRLPHAILLSGPEGLGKLDFARDLAYSLLCSSPDERGNACGHCDSCKLLHAGTHPDFLYLAPESPEKAIKVDDIRQLCQALTLTSQYEGYKVVIIASADNMNVNAANSLLKTLEEPGANTILILESSRTYRLPITIRSRCQTIKFPIPKFELAQQWLESQAVDNAAIFLPMAHGAPLKAQKLADAESSERRKLLTDALIAVAENRPVTEWAEKLAKHPSGELLGWLYDWIGDLIRQNAGQQSIHVPGTQSLRKITAHIQQTDLFSLLDEVISLKKMQSIPLNAQMFWEDLLISWNRITKRA